MMINRPFRKPLVIGLMLIAAQSFAGAQQAVDEKPDAQAIEKIVHNYILQHPEVVLESVRGYDQRAKAAEKEHVRDTVKAHLSELYKDSPATESVAAQTGQPVTLVEFFDYRCGYCKKVEDTVAGLAQQPGVRIVYKDLPILGPDSTLAAQAALAAEKQGKYPKFHHALLTSPNPLTQDSIEKTAAQNGLDVARLKKDMTSTEIKAALARNHELAEKLGIQATPTFVVGTDLVSGALSPQAFQSLIAAVRQGAAATSKPQSVGGL